MSREASSEIRLAVRRMVTESGGQMIRRREPGYSLEWEEPEPLAGIRAAAGLQFEAGQAIARAARFAREDGLTWEQIGEALYPGKRGPDGDRPKSVRAFSQLASAYDIGWESPSFSWTCQACGKRVSDYGPDGGTHPSDTEQGHAESCTRLAAAVAEYMAQWEDE
jgi:hypothetical protein